MITIIIIVEYYSLLLFNFIVVIVLIITKNRGKQIRFGFVIIIISRITCSQKLDTKTTTITTPTMIIKQQQQ